MNKRLTPAQVIESLPRPTVDEYLTPAQVTELVPGISTGQLAQLRYLGNGPRFRKPTRKTVVYRRSEVIDWVERSARQGTAPDAA